MSECRGHHEVGAPANVFNQGLSLSPNEPNVEITKVTTLMRALVGGIREGPK